MTPLQKAVDAAQQKLAGFGKGVMAFGAAFGGLGALVSAPFLYGLGVFSDWGKELIAGSRRTGIEIGLLGALAYATGADIDTLGASMDKLGSFLEGAAEGTAKANHALLLMGLNFEDLNRMNQHERLLAIADGLERIADAGQRAAIKREVLGKGAASMNLSGGSEGIQQREATAVRLGRSLSKEDQQIVVAYNAATRELDATVKAVWTTLGATIAPFMTDFKIQITGIIQAIVHWLQNNKELVETVFRIADAAVTLSVPIIALGGAFYGASIVLGFFMPMLTAFGAILGAVGSVVTFVTGGMGLFGLATWIVSSAVSFAAGGFGLVTAATWAYGVAAASVSGVLGFLAGAWGIVTTGAAFAAGGFGVMTAATWVANAATGAYSLALGVSTGILGTYTAATFAASFGSSAFSAGLWLGTAAMGAYNFALGLGASAVATFEGLLTLAGGGFGLFTALSVAASAAMGAYNAVLSVASLGSSAFAVGLGLGSAAMGAYSFLIGVGSAALTLFEAALAFGAGGFGVFTLLAIGATVVSALFEGVLFLAALAVAGFDVVMAAASFVFGLFTGASLAGAAASAVFEGVVWLCNVAMLAYNLAVGLANGQISFMAIASGAAAIAMAAVKIVTWLASVAMGVFTGASYAAATGTTIATGGINLLLAALGLLAIVVLASPFLIFGNAIVQGLRAAGGALSGFFGIFRGIGDAAGGIADSFLSGVARIGTAFSSLWESLGTGFSNLFGKLVDDAMGAWDGISAAFKIGDMELAWSILKTTAQIAWIEVVDFALDAWIAIKYSFWEIAYLIGDTLVDVFQKSWTALRILFEQGWAFVKAGAWETAAVVAESLFQNDLAAAFRQRAANVNTLAGLQTDLINAQANAAQLTRNNERSARDDELQDDRDTEEARRGFDNNGAEIAELRERLNADLRFANYQAEMAQIERELNGEEAPGETPGYVAGGDKAFGTFSKDLSGLFGASLTPAERAARAAEEANRTAEEMLLVQEEANRQLIIIAQNLRFEFQ